LGDEYRHNFQIVIRGGDGVATQHARQQRPNHSLNGRPKHTGHQQLGAWLDRRALQTRRWRREGAPFVQVSTH
jgi:hypothetical protein